MTRFAVATLAGGVASGLALLRVGTILAPAVWVLAFLALAALGAGFLAARLGWLAGLLSVLVGVAVHVIGAGEGDRPAASLVALWLYLALSLFPVVLLCTLAGALGGWSRARILRRR